MLRKLLTTLCFVAFFAQMAFAQTGTITGQVMDHNGETVPGANVLLVETGQGAATNADGEYTISNVESGTYTLRVTFVGFQEYNQQVTIESGETVEVNVSLESGAAELDEVVVVGYGTQARRDLTSSISSVSSEQLENTELNTLENALQGNTAGVQVTQAGGTLGSPSAVRIRGTASINADAQPLYVVDGVPITTGDGSIGREVSGVGIGTNPLININPDDIESIEVLKDAAASAIYGSRGSNGVVLITTKSGVAGQTQVNFSYSGGVTEATDEYDMLNGQQFTEMWNTAGENFFESVGLTAEQWYDPAVNAAVFGTDASLSEDPSDISSTDWMELVQRQGSIQQVNASVSGGNEQTQYRISTGFNDRYGYVKGNRLQRYSARVKVDHQISDEVQVGLNIAPTYSRNFKRSERNQVDAPITFSALYYPNVPARTEEGEPNLSVDPNAFVAFTGTPLTNLQGTEIEEDLQQTVISSNLNWNIVPQLELNTDVSVDLFQLVANEKRSDLTTDGFGVGTGLNLNESYVNYNWNATLRYAEDFGVHSFTGLVGTSLQRSENLTFDVSGNGFPSNDLKTLDSAAEITGGGASISSYAFLGYLSRITYSYDDKYLLTLNGRVDGSSRFGADNQYGFFPAASAGWVISDEDFLNDSNVIDFLKLRASYGVTGNADGIGNFPALALAEAGSDYNGTSGLSVSQLANPELRWEKATQLDIGLDYGFFNNRVRGSLAVFEKNTSDLLLDRPISATNGFDSFTQNEGEMRNYGLEFDVTADLVSSADFQWTSSFNISFIENEVESLIGGDDINAGEQIVREGEPLGAFYLREFAGANPEDGLAVWYLNREATDEELNDPESGIFINEERFGDRPVTTNYGSAERIIAGDPFPDFFGGFRNNFRFKGFDLRVFLQYTYGNDIYRADGEFLDSNLPSLFNQSTRQLNHWKEEGDVTDIPKPILFTANGSQSSTRFLEDGSYMRLKNVTFGYTLPTEVTQDYTVRLFVQGTNLYTLTSDEYDGMDPEVTSAPSTNINQGNVFFAPAQARTFQAGIDFQF